MNVEPKVGKRLNTQKFKRVEIYFFFFSVISGIFSNASVKLLEASFISVVIFL